MRVRHIAVALACWVSACTIDEAGNPGARCARDSECAPGSCYRGFCVGAMDGGTSCTPSTRMTCYTASDQSTLGRGECEAGESECGADGRWGACLGETVPTAEVPCNGLDENCNEAVDEFAVADCDTTLMGICSAGTNTCRGSEVVCEPAAVPEAETCNGTDDDCDGATDDGADTPCYPTATLGCTEGAPGIFTCLGVCATGTHACTAGALSTICSGPTTPQIDDGCTAPGTTATDDDCNGMTDEDCLCTAGTMQDCYGGPDGTRGIGTCVAGNQTCVGMRFGACTGEVTPEPEACANDGFDDDCNGSDDDVAGRGDPCTIASAMGICSAGTRACVGGSLVCDGPDPRTEICNGLDDDCDGTTDDGFDLSTDELNCGVCGRACGPGLGCCDGSCVDQRVDAAHCGACGTACTAGACCNSACTDTGSDELNCGSCGVPCAAGRQCCGGVCSDLTQDEAHCGTCETMCGGTQACCNSVCGSPTAPACTACTEDCGLIAQTCCVPSCADLATDTSNCGMCGRACTAGQLCCGGACVDNDRAHCGSCALACTGTDLCCGGSCVMDDVANCHACGTTCGAGRACCGAGCLDIVSDRTNCGACGNICPAGQNCSNRICCPAGQRNCGGACVDTNADNNNCGICGTVCGGITPRCCSGVCRTSLCL